MVRGAFTALLMWAAVAGCGSDVDRNPLLPGGGNGTGGMEPLPDLDGGSGDGTFILTGRICELSDFRVLAVCQDRPPGVDISILGVSDTTDGDGAYSLELDARLAGRSVTMLLDDPDGIYVTATVPVVLPALGEPANIDPPIISVSTLETIADGLGESTSELSATIFTYIFRGGSPLAGAQITLPPVGTLGGTYYDSDSPPFVDVGAGTGPFGLAVMFGVPEVDGVAAFTVAGSAEESGQDALAPVIGGGVAFVPFDAVAPQTGPLRGPRPGEVHGQLGLRQGALACGRMRYPRRALAPDSLTIRRPDDWHVHLRDGDALALVAPHTARHFGRAIVMPNLVPPITTVDAARQYRERIRAALLDGQRFEPLMTAYLTDDIDPDEIERGFEAGVFTACKLYPANATTNSARGVTAVERIHRVLERMQSLGMPLLVHGEVTERDVDIFDREAAFVSSVLGPLTREFSSLKVVVEHITTKEAAEFVSTAREGIAATITPHHLVINRNDLLVGGIRPHLYCLPIAKRERHRQALRRAATSGSPRFFLGTDSAPHAVLAKESACGCAGIFSAPMAIACYAEVFAEEDALDRLEGFASLHGPAFYGMAPNDDQMVLVRSPFEVPRWVGNGDARVAVFRGGETVCWRVSSAG